MSGMAFDDATRGRLQRFVGAVRALLTEEFARQLQHDYGLDPSTGDAAPLDSLADHDDRRLETARILREILAHYLAADGATGTADCCTVLDRIVREQAFTILNRLAALRMMEARGILIESVAKGYQSRGFQLYQRVANGALGEAGEAYRCFLFSVFDTFAADLPALFDRHAPLGRLFPREAVLLAVLKEFDAPDLEALWGEDETIGWIYQYFNSREERQAMRRASQAPRNSRELAVRNQFFTPRYVVEFLVDNTLGRLWFNWTGGATSLRDRCRYLLVKPDEEPEPTVRPRDPRTIKLLDPACGSMHFGLYAFDLFLEIYREAWAWEAEHGPGSLDTSTRPEVGLVPLSETYSDEAAFLRDAPRLIVEHNIYGVEIDPRAAQIASLALWLRAQRAWHDAGVKAADRPSMGRGNVVAAIAPPAEVDLRKELMAEMDEIDAELFEKTLFLLKGLPELGVLLQVERELPALIRKIYREQTDFLRGGTKRWQEIEVRLRCALTEFARAARSSYQGRLFAMDALEGLRLIDLTRHELDVVVMNPPFGFLSLGVKSELSRNYPHSRIDLLAIFVERGASLLRPSGRLGAITSRTCFFLSSFTEWRQKVVLGETRPEVVADLGYGVMDDAAVEAAAYVLDKV
jgi:Eco57I restriction-modification methylase